MFSIAEMQTKVIFCNIANKSCLLQVVHTKAIAALTQFCDFCTSSSWTLLVRSAYIMNPMTISVKVYAEPYIYAFEFATLTCLDWIVCVWMTYHSGSEGVLG